MTSSLKEASTAKSVAVPAHEVGAPYACGNDACQVSKTPHIQRSTAFICTPAGGTSSVLLYICVVLPGLAVFIARGIAPAGVQVKLVILDLWLLWHCRPANHSCLRALA